MVSKKKRIAVVFGTRPEVIKLARVIHKLSSSSTLEPYVISTGQHRDMIAPLVDWFGLRVDHDLALMSDNQTPQMLLARAMQSLDDVFGATEPEAVLVQGDTSTALAGAIAAFHKRIPVGHVEAGLRTGEIYSPFPEEANRSLIGRLATWNFAPTHGAKKALTAESAPGETVVVGNTVVDALLWTSEKLGERTSQGARVLVTAHRRENFGGRMREALNAIGDLASAFPKVEFLYPVHRNPNVFHLAKEVLGDRDNVHLLDPLPYPEMVALLRSCTLVISDSGGIQEEAPTFGIPLLILRDSTERPEVIESGIGSLVGTSRTRIVSAATEILGNETKRDNLNSTPNPFGDGRTSDAIEAFLSSRLTTE
ncbi:UDP-N-acetylglucosamine 2-epimerase (non-hydrolyzing) [Nitratireductor aquibiodomus]|uniref:non-hydrolyzing UDP-N-acetylglucosamine 2-epimerase n=1 Tax=Nitratireductor aquibiodomus TaxID=204799 RepID=UPI0019D3C390|nr:UDP-N-acetylglucosamine 2-epimerase (non-hydrolyzing) [Nitratireductor aquibiodomus]MBN7762759.1 UDP-N-acetylglucosamine 2-epimerase (non-hydrolyzing) [Nitratireductor aquibiodomus]